MKVGLTEDEIRLLMESVEHFDAFLHSQQRESDEVKALPLAFDQSSGPASPSQ